MENSNIILIVNGHPVLSIILHNGSVAERKG